MTVLVTYVPTPEGWAALDAGIAEATARSARLAVVNVVVNGNFADVTAADERDLDSVRARLVELGLPNEVRQPLDVRDVADELLAQAGALGASLIVVGLRRRSPVGKALLGSTAQKVILGADCPVLSVRPSQ